MCYSKLDCFFSNSLSNFPITRVENAAKVVLFYFTGKYISFILFFFNIDALSFFFESREEKFSSRRGLLSSRRGLSSSRRELSNPRRELKNFK